MAVLAARRAFDEGPWSKMFGDQRSKLMHRLADLMEKNKEHLAALEAIDNGKSYNIALNVDIPMSIEYIRYYAGWADKIHGTQYPNDGYLTYTYE